MACWSLDPSGVMRAGCPRRLGVLPLDLKSLLRFIEIFLLFQQNISCVSLTETQKCANFVCGI